ncbi:hypothetical protein [Blastopirellula marina]|uniref:Uncharacterized protein n=1 Tax=Blastopirellula marina TaxID=124 RepID=A0A2S8G6A0_9BACT|nr:hypothetical protein [Blastopirellula marina]PQO39982.1 hypothetical protein C5Y98_06590 [Blastopirellula marina]PTL45357.1 hypothetical protein C5Y97_06590 [Blastopirellula marina]
MVKDLLAAIFRKRPGVRKASPWNLREAATLAAFLTTLGLIEWVGRTSQTELKDFACAIVLATAVRLVFSRYFCRRVRWASSLSRQVRRLWNRFTAAIRYDWGLDLRRSPPIAHGLPRLFLLAPLLAAVGLAAAVSFTLATGVTLRETVPVVSYLVYLAPTAAIWGALVVLVFGAAFSPGFVLFDALLVYGKRPERESFRWSVAFASIVAGAILALTLLAPAWIATIIWGVTLLMSLAANWLTPAWRPDCLWRKGSSDVRAMPMYLFLTVTDLLIGLVPAIPVAVALGGETIGFASHFESAPISVGLGRLAIWYGTFAYLASTLLMESHYLLARLSDPSRPTPLALHFAGVERPRQRRELRQLARRNGWKVRFAPSEPDRLDVRLQMADSTSPAGETNVICLHLDDLEAEETLARIRRRDQVQKRRVLVKGIELIFRRAAARKQRDGSGYWLAPHYWFFPGLTRDVVSSDDANSLDVIPPLYRDVMPRAARHHFFEICQALGIDLIFVEDGVDFYAVRRVLRVMFERYDIDGGKRPLEEVHFSGLPKVRVLIHEFAIDQSPRKTKYPEPSYQYLGRAKILHIYRDRGDDEEQSPTPETPELLLSPVGSY